MKTIAPDENNTDSKFYRVLSGELTSKTKTEAFKLRPKEGRGSINETNQPVNMLAVINY